MTGNRRKEAGPSRGEAVANYITDLLKNSIEIVADYSCKYHPDRAATAVCEWCNADLCSHCAHIRGHRLVCGGCMGSLDRTFAGTGAASVLTRLLTHPVVVALVLTTLLGGLFVGLGRIHRKGLLGEVPATAGGVEKQFRLKLVLYVQKADRIETHADELREIGRADEAAADYERARSIHETLAREAAGRWEEQALTLARARVLEKMGNRAYAQGLYENIANLPGPDKTYPVIAQFHLAKLQEKMDPEEAVATYKRLLRDVNFVPDNFSRAVNIMAHSQGAYNYESRIRYHTRTDFDFDTVKVETLLQMGRLFLTMGRTDEAGYRLRQAVTGGHGTKLGEQAMAELRKLHAVDVAEEPPEEEAEEEEQLTITHFD